jgi:protein-arginine deiminase
MTKRAFWGCAGSLMLLVACGGDERPHDAGPSTGAGTGAAGGAGGDAAAGGGGAGGGTGGTPWGAEPFDVAVDTNRDGAVDLDDPADQEGEDAWSADGGAILLANLDDDDADALADARDEVVNGDADAEDVARIRVRAWPEAPDGASGLLALDVGAAAAVRLFRHDPDGGWTLVAGSVGPCNTVADCVTTPEYQLTTEELRAGLELGIEARDLRRSLEPNQWTGMVELTYQVLDDSGQLVTSAETPDGTDHATLRVAPWLMFGQLAAFDRIWSADASSVFVADLTDGIAAAGGATYQTYDQWNDVWTGDFFGTGWTALPGPADGVRGMRVALARPWGRAQGEEYLPLTWLAGNAGTEPSYLGPDRGAIAVYDTPETGGTGDSFGNHLLIPPHAGPNGTWNLGRILVGSNVLPETTAFYDAQEVQGPHIGVDTSWLAVGHVGEVVAFLPANTPRGWKMTVASPALMLELLEGLAALGHGSATIHDGKGQLYESTVAQVLADDFVADANGMAQARIDAIVATIAAETGLTTQEIVPLPVLFQDLGDGLMVPWTTDGVGSLALGDHLLVPRPFGPVVAGADAFEADLLERLGSASNALGSSGQGMTVHLVDSWFYHANLGRLAAGINRDAPAPFSSTTWWSAGR